MDTFLALDTSLFLAVNRLPHTDLMNTIAMVFSGIGQWGLVWIIVAIALFFREEVRDHFFFVPFIAVGIVSGISEYVLKWIIARPRPYAEMGALILDTPGNYSFPSTHATLAFAYAYICSTVEPKIQIWAYILACIISFSRMYLGVHYAFDILGGAILGTGIGIVVRAGEQKWFVQKKNVKKRK